MAIGAGPLYTNAIMGHTLTAAEIETARKASSTILREDRIQIEESDYLSRQDSFSIHCNYTDQAPYCTGEDSRMMTQKSLLHIPKENPSHELALFLRLTGPTQPHRRPGRLENGDRNLSGRRKSLRFLKMKRRRSPSPPPMAKECIEVASGEQVASIAATKLGLVEQKVSLDGTKYLALNVREDSAVLHSRTSVLCVPRELDDDRNSECRSQSRLYRRPPTPANPLALQATSYVKSDSRAEVARAPRIVRKAVSTSATPEPESAISVTYSMWTETERRTAQPAGAGEGTRQTPITGARKLASASLPNVLHAVDPPCENTGLSLAKREEMRHPTPQRLASHPILGRSAAHIAADMSPRSVSDSPGPPERSPLRLREVVGVDEREFQSERKTTIKAVPSIVSLGERTNSKMIPLIKPTVVTDCTGPIKRPWDRAQTGRSPATSSKRRKEREERTRERKLRDRPTPTKKGESTFSNSNKTPSTPRQRLKKARPQIQVPTQATSHTARASSSASSNASWKKVTEYTRHPVSVIPSEDAQSSPDRNGRLPISPSTARTARSERITMTPVMLIAEERPVSRSTRSSSRAAKIVLRDGKSYAPRPRSASIPSIMQRRSRPGSRAASRPDTPPEGYVVHHVPPLPSTPPQCALPPLPRNHSSTKSRRSKQTTLMYPRKPVPIRTYATYAAKADSDDKRISTVRSKYHNWPINPPPTVERPDIYARVEALEKKNALLLEKLNTMAMTQVKASTPAENLVVPMAWENRIARRTAASRLAANNGRPQEVSKGARYGGR